MATTYQISQALEKFMRNGYHSLDDMRVLADAYCEQQLQIDETATMPAFVGDDEIEIAGVMYVRKDRQQQPVNERLLEAAKHGLQWLAVDERNYGVPTATGTALRAAIEAAENEANLPRAMGGAT